MAKTYDLIVFGATGFTGKKVVHEVTQHPPKKDLAWAIGGRDITKLEALLQSLDLSVVRAPVILVADSEDQAQLEAVLGQAQVCISCVGPFRLYGESVMRACISTKTHYTDICGETEFIERSYYELSALAAQNQTSVVPCCGYDSLPADFGTLLTRLEFQKRDAICSQIEVFIKFLTGKHGVAVNATTFISAVLGFARFVRLTSYGSLMRLRKKHHQKPNKPLGATLHVYRNPRWNPDMHAYTIPAAVSDIPVIKLGLQINEMLKEKNALELKNKSYKPSDLPPVQIAGYFCFSSYWSVIYVSYLGVLFKLGARFDWFRKQLIAYPDFYTLGIFKKAGPSQAQLEESSFEQHFHGKGIDAAGADITIKTVLKGPEMGYVTTPISVVSCASMLLNRLSSIPSGVITPAVAFANVAGPLSERLESRGIKFSVSD